MEKLKLYLEFIFGFKKKSIVGRLENKYIISFIQIEITDNTE